MKKSMVKAFAVLAGVMMLFTTACSSDGDSGAPETTSVTNGAKKEETGTVGITVTVDGKIQCAFCAKEYEKMADAKACEHYKCSVCSSQYASQEELDACTAHTTVNFVNSEDDTKNYTVTIKTGTKAKFPTDWNKDNADTLWASDPAEVDPNAAIEVDEVTFTATWKSYVVCAECGEHCDDEAAATAHATADKTCPNCNTVCASKAAVADCAVHEGCPKWTIACTECGKSYSTTAAAEDCATADKTCPNCETVHTSKAAVETCNTKEGCPGWYAECSNCHTHYTTQSGADNCAKQDGCPQFGKDNDWIAGDASLPSWLDADVLLGSASSDSKKASFDMTNFKKLAKDNPIKVTPGKVCTINFYVVANGAASKAKNYSVTVDGTVVASGANNALNATTPLSVTVTEAQKDKTFIFTTEYESLYFAIKLE